MQQDIRYIVLITGAMGEAKESRSIMISGMKSAMMSLMWSGLQKRKTPAKS
jgi:hypothetical protein